MPDPVPDVFFGYASQPEAEREAMATAAHRLGETRLVRARPWEQLKIGGQLAIAPIVEAIATAAVSVFDVTSLNQNVAFEVGYAIGSGRRLWLVRNETDQDAARRWKQFGILSGVIYRPFTNSDDVFGAFLNDRPDESQEATLFQQAIEHQLASAGRTSVLFVPALPADEAARALGERLRQERDKGLRFVTDDASESSTQSLGWYGREVYAAGAVLVQLSPERRRASDVQNARAAFVAGLAHGMGRPVLMLADPEYPTPVDYKELLYRYRNSRDCIAHVDEWLSRHLSVAYERIAQDRKRALPLKLSTELREMRLGEHVAENEEEALNDYFVETASYREVVADRTAVFVGRRGEGKTANRLQAARFLRNDPRNLVVAITPVGYEWESVLRLLKAYQEKDAKGYLIESLWKFLLYSEITVEALAEAARRPSGPVEGTPEWDLERFVEEKAPFVREEFAVRLERAVASVSQPSGSPGVEAERLQISESLHDGVLRELRVHLGRVLTKRRRVAVLVDNLDKPWERGADVEQLSHFLLGLIGSVSRLSDELKKGAQWRESIPVTIAVFLRSDIYEAVARTAREPDKLPVSRLAWANDDGLLRVVEQRFVSRRSPGTSPALLWEEYFCETVRGLPTRDYLVSRVLPRPRDLVFICNEAISTAVNRSHSHVEESDVIAAEEKYSQYAFDSVRVEDALAGSSVDVESLLYEFLGGPSQLPEGDLLKLIEHANVPKDRASAELERLRSLTFLGVETKSNYFSYSQNPDERQRDTLLSERLAVEHGGDRRYQVHPAFRRFLELDEPSPGRSSVPAN